MYQCDLNGRITKKGLKSYVIRKNVLNLLKGFKRKSDNGSSLLKKNCSIDLNKEH